MPVPISLFWDVLSFQFALTSPVETICTVLQAEQQRPSEGDPEQSLVTSDPIPKRALGDALLSIYRKNGFAGFWNGYFLSIMLTVNPAINFMTYEYLKKLITKFSSRAAESRCSKQMSAMCLHAIVSAHSIELFWF